MRFYEAYEVSDTDSDKSFKDLLINKIFSRHILA